LVLQDKWKSMSDFGVMHDVINHVLIVESLIPFQFSPRNNSESIAKANRSGAQISPTPHVHNNPLSLPRQLHHRCASTELNANNLRHFIGSLNQARERHRSRGKNWRSMHEVSHTNSRICLPVRCCRHVLPKNQSLRPLVVLVNPKCDTTTDEGEHLHHRGEHSKG
jgi:hypothetical protein